MGQTDIKTDEDEILENTKDRQSMIDIRKQQNLPQTKQKVK